jgi:hypothetical protein
MQKVLPLLILLTGCAGGPSMEAINMDSPEKASEPTLHHGWFSFFRSTQEANQAPTAGAQAVSQSAEDINQTQKVCEDFWLVPLSGCARNISIEVTKLDLAENTYELVPRPGWLSFSISTEEVKQALTARAQEICAPGSVATLDLDRPNYIGVDIAPRGYLHCR